jgi:AcrR family transcriptional regulator
VDAPTRGTLSRDRLVAEAAQLVDESGFDALSLRAVARRLGVTPMALYGYVTSKDELVDLVVERLVTASAWIPPEDPVETLLQFGRGLRRLVIEHPAILQAYQRGAVFTTGAQHAAEIALSALKRLGLEPQDCVDAYVLLHMFVLGFAATEHAGDRPRTRPAVDPASGNPTLASLAPQLGEGLTSAQFDRSLAQLLDGLTSRGASNL